VSRPRLSGFDFATVFWFLTGSWILHSRPFRDIEATGFDLKIPSVLSPLLHVGELLMTLCVSRYKKLLVFLGRVESMDESGPRPLSRFSPCPPIVGTVASADLVTSSSPYARQSSTHGQPILRLFFRHWRSLMSAFLSPWKLQHRFSWRTRSY